LKVEKGITVNDFIKQYYNDCITSAFNIVRTKYPAANKEDARELVHRLVEYLLSRSVEYENVGEVAHRWMDNQVKYGYNGQHGFNAFMNVSNTPFFETLIEETECENCEELKQLAKQSGLTPSEWVVFDNIIDGNDSKQLAIDLGLKSKQIGHVYGQIKKKIKQTYDNKYNNSNGGNTTGNSK
jgi:hypothetical protein